MHQQTCVCVWAAPQARRGRLPLFKLGCPHSLGLVIGGFSIKGKKKDVSFWEDFLCSLSLWISISNHPRKHADTWVRSPRSKGSSAPFRLGCPAKSLTLLACHCAFRWRRKDVRCGRIGTPWRGSMPSCEIITTVFSFPSPIWKGRLGRKQFGQCHLGLSSCVWYTRVDQ